MNKFRFLTTLFFFMFLISYETFSQSYDGYYEYVDTVYKIIDRMIIEKNQFESYYSTERALIIGIGKCEFTDKNLFLQYDSLSAIRYFTVLGFPYGKLKKKLELSYKIDTSKYKETFGPYKIYLKDSLDNRIEITNGYKTKRYDTLINSSVILKTSYFTINLPFSNVAAIQNWVLSFDNTSMVAHNPGRNIFQIVEISEDKMVLISNNKILNYRRYKTIEPNFLEYLKIQKQIQIRF